MGTKGENATDGASTHGRPVDWLSGESDGTGISSDLKLPGEDAIVAIYRKASPDHRKLLLKIMEAAAGYEVGRESEE